MKAQEEYTSMAAANTRERKDKEWQAAKTTSEKYSILKAYDASIAPYSDIVNKLLVDYPGISQDELLGKVAKVMMQRADAKDFYMSSIAAGKPLTGPLWDQFASLI